MSQTSSFITQAISPLLPLYLQTRTMLASSFHWQHKGWGTHPSCVICGIRENVLCSQQNSYKFLCRMEWQGLAHTARLNMIGKQAWDTFKPPQYHPFSLLKGLLQPQALTWADFLWHTNNRKSTILVSLDPLQNLPCLSLDKIKHCPNSFGTVSRTFATPQLCHGWRYPILFKLYQVIWDSCLSSRTTSCSSARPVLPAQTAIPESREKILIEVTREASSSGSLKSLRSKAPSVETLWIAGLLNLTGMVLHRKPPPVRTGVTIHLLMGLLLIGLQSDDIIIPIRHWWICENIPACSKHAEYTKLNCTKLYKMSNIYHLFLALIINSKVWHSDIMKSISGSTRKRIPKIVNNWNIWKLHTKMTTMLC